MCNVSCVMTWWPVVCRETLVKRWLVPMCYLPSYCHLPCYGTPEKRWIATVPTQLPKTTSQTITTIMKSNMNTPWKISPLPPRTPTSDHSDHNHYCNCERLSQPIHTFNHPTHSPAPLNITNLEGWGIWGLQAIVTLVCCNPSTEKTNRKTGILFIWNVSIKKKNILALNIKSNMAPSIKDISTFFQKHLPLHVRSFFLLWSIRKFQRTFWNSCLLYIPYHCAGHLEKKPVHPL